MYSGNWREQHAHKMANEKIPKKTDLAAKARRRALRVEVKFRLKHGMSSMEHLNEVMNFRNEVFDDCECFACVKARYVPQRIKILYVNGDN